MIADDALAGLERSVEMALRTGDTSGLRLLGQGEISLVLAAGTEGGPGWACKRLPPFRSVAAADRYERLIDRYVALLADRGIDVIDTTVRRVRSAKGQVVLYCVQPILPARSLAVAVAHADHDGGRDAVAAIVDTVLDVVDATVGLDAQLSNWAVADGRLVYVDVTTPLLRDHEGRSELDTEVFLASLPWALRGPVRRFVVPGILQRYHDPRTVTLDVASNLLKEHLDPLVPAVLTAASGRVEPPLSTAEVAADRRSDARTWAALQAVRRLDRSWQRQVRRRPYPFLLPDRAAS